MLDLCGPNLDDETQFQMAIRASLEESTSSNNHVIERNSNGQSKHSSKSSPKKFGIVHSPEKTTTTTLFVQVRKPKIVRKNNSRRSQSRIQQPMGEVTS